jgi:drug/metabolite transporter (DMT)-like permease
MIMRKAVIYGITASFFFAFTFVLNRQMNISGGSWIWSASLRYIFMLPMLLGILISRGAAIKVMNEIKRNPLKWLIWSTIGFGLFYAPLSCASVFGPSWLIAGTWQITIIAGALLSPLFFKKIKTNDGILKVRNKLPVKSLLITSIILVGIFLMQFQEAAQISAANALFGCLLVIVAAFSYPLGNRKMMELCGDNLNTIERIFGMTLCSLPFWIFLSIWGVSTVGIPVKDQIFQALIVAIFSGIIATVLFFKATDMAKDDIHKLAVIESTQAGEVIFTLLGGVLLFKDRLPSVLGFMGILLVIAGMIFNNLSITKSA